MNVKRVVGEKNQKEFDKNIIRSLNHEMYLQLVKKITLSQFDDKRCYMKKFKSKPWN